MAGQYNTYAEQGATWTKTITWTDSNNAPVNLTGYTAKMEAKDQGGLYTLFTLTQASGITLGGSAGTIVPLISATATAAFPVGTYLYDLFLTSPSGFVTRLLAGTFSVVERITE